MKEDFIKKVQKQLIGILADKQLMLLEEALYTCFCQFDLVEKTTVEAELEIKSEKYLQMFLAAKKIEGCSDKTINYYYSTIIILLKDIKKDIEGINTEDLRCYLANYQTTRKISKVTLDNVRRIFSSFFAWLEDEDYIVKSPVRRIHKVKVDKIIKGTYSDENIEVLRDNCTDTRELALIDLLNSTGMRVGELVRLDIADIDFNNRECIVFGKGNKERTVYFDAKTKVHLLNYINSRTDTNTALFVSIRVPHNRLKIGGIQCCLSRLGRLTDISKVHPHKFRRTMATAAIDKGMPIEQVQKLLGHVKIDTTMHYAIVNQQNVKIAHRKYIG